MRVMDWFQTTTRELETFFDIEERISEEEKKQRGLEAIHAFHEIFMHLASKLRLRDDWPDAHCHIMPFSTGIIERSAKMRVEFTLGVSLYGWFIESPVAFPAQIRHMGDEYWDQIVRLSKIGKAELHDYGRPVGWPHSPGAKKLVQHKTSLVFSVARDFTLLASKSEDETESLGGIHVSVPVESDQGAVTTFFERGLDALYRSNYLLFRSAYLQRRRILKKFAGANTDAESQGFAERRAHQKLNKLSRD